MDVRIRFPELLAERDETPYSVARKSGGRIAPNTAYRLRKAGGRVRLMDSELLAALVDVFGITRLDELFSRDDEPPAPKAKLPARAKRARAT